MKTQKNWGFISLLIALSAALFSTSAASAQYVACQTASKELQAIGVKSVATIVVNNVKEPSWLDKSCDQIAGPWNKKVIADQPKLKTLADFPKDQIITIKDLSDNTELKVALYCEGTQVFKVGIGYNGKPFHGKPDAEDLKRYSKTNFSCSTQLALR